MWRDLLLTMYAGDAGRADGTSSPSASARSRQAPAPNPDSIKAGLASGNSTGRSMRIGQGQGMGEMEHRGLKSIEMRPIGFVARASPRENDRDRSLVARVVLDEGLAPALDGIEGWSHIYVIFWLDRVARTEEPVSHHKDSDLGIFAARSPIHPNPIGLTLVELVKREGNVLWVRGLDAHDGTPVLDVKPYPDWEQDLIVVTDFRVPEWLMDIIQQGQLRPLTSSEHGTMIQ